MSVISVYRVFYWDTKRLTGQTGYAWETKEDQARCIEDALSHLVTMSRVGPPPLTPRTKDQEQRDARNHISRQDCLCGIHGYFSPNYLVLMTATAAWMTPLEHRSGVVYARVRLSGLVDIHSMGARGEYGLIEEAWCDDDAVAEAVAKQYGIPVNQSKFTKQPRTDPLIDKDAKILKLSSLFTGMLEAVGVKSSVGPIINIPTQKMGWPPAISSVRFGPSNLPLPGSPTARQRMTLAYGATPPPINPFGAPAPTPSAAPGNSPCQCGICARVAARSSRTSLCPALLGGSCLCGAHGPSGRGVLGSWQCLVCGTYERYSSDHVRCSGAPPKITLKPIGIDKKPGIITRLKRKLGI